MFTQENANNVWYGCVLKYALAQFSGKSIRFDQLCSIIIQRTIDRTFAGIDCSSDRKCSEVCIPRMHPAHVTNVTNVMEWNFNVIYAILSLSPSLFFFLFPSSVFCWQIKREHVTRVILRIAAARAMPQIRRVSQEVRCWMHKNYIITEFRLAAISIIFQGENSPQSHLSFFKFPGICRENAAFFKEWIMRDLASESFQVISS